MQFFLKSGLAAGVGALCSFVATPSHASLLLFQSYSGQYSVSTDGAAYNSGPASTISASAPSGATVTAAYLYTATYTFDDTTTTPDLSGVTLNGNAVSYGATFSANPNASFPTFALGSARADVTSIVAPVINGGAGGTYNFSYSEGVGSTNIDGSALVVVYSHPGLQTSTVGILQGFASVTGDVATMSFAQALDPTAPGFNAEMFLGIGFSCGSCGQSSTVAVNGNLMTSVAGGADDGTEANGQLITVGGFNDAPTGATPGFPQNNYLNDAERYNLKPFLSVGDMVVSITTANASQDDNIFLAVFNVTGEGRISTGDVPLPAGAWLFGSVLLGTSGYMVRRRRRAATTVAT